MHAERGQGLRKLQQCYSRLKDVQRQLACQQVSMRPGVSCCKVPAGLVTPATHAA